jgi:hypothetical protein
MRSRLSGRPVIGLIGGNRLRHFRADIDYPKSRLYLKQESADDETPIDMVGVMLASSRRGYLNVRVADTAIALKNDDDLLRIADAPISGLDMAQIMRKFSGVPGAMRRLTIKREHRTLSVSARVIRNCSVEFVEEANSCILSVGPRFPVVC